MITRRIAATCTLFGALVGATPAYAEDPTERRSATSAQALFEEARQLATKGEWAAACPKLARSYGLDPRPTTLYRLADCYERTGKPASAWRAYTAAASQAEASGETRRAEVASARAKHLEPSLSYVIFTVEARPVAISRDGEPVDEASWGTRTPIDPGDHEITARANGKRPFHTRIRVPSVPSMIAVTIPALEDDAAAVRSPSPGAASENTTIGPADPESPPPGASGDLTYLRPWGLGVGAIGLVGLGLGSLIVVNDDDRSDRGTAATLMVSGAVATVIGVALTLVSLTKVDDPQSTKPQSSLPLGFRF